MIASRCCKAQVYVVHHYYVCEQCHLACDTFNQSYQFKEDDDDAGSQSEIKEHVGAG